MKDSIVARSPARGADRSTGLLVGHWVFVAAVLIAVSLRLTVRTTNNRLWWDDFTIVIATGLTLFGAIASIFFTGNGIGRHIDTLTPHQISKALEWVVIAELESFVCLFFIRLSVALFLFRVFARTQKRIHYIIYAALALNVAATIIVVVTFAIQCIPLEGLWNRSIKAKCFDEQIATNVNRMFSSVSAACDLVYALLPVFVISKLQMDYRTKIGVIAVMTMGVLMAGCAIAKAATVDLTSPDPTYTLAVVTWFAMLEANIGIVAACLPGIREFYIEKRKGFGSLRSHDRSWKSIVGIKRASYAAENRTDSNVSTNHPKYDKRNAIRRLVEIDVSMDARDEDDARLHDPAHLRSATVAEARRV